MRRVVVLVLLVLFLSALAAHVGAASRYLPHLRFRVLVTPHFRIYYHQGGEALARELAAIAEEVRRDLPARLNLPAPGVTHVVVADQDDASNGSAIPVPYNTITLTAAWPAQSELIGFTRNWLHLVFAHEYAHILHTDRSRGWASIMRGVFGRSPVAFPNLALPLWQIEGFATWVESSSTGEGRVRAGDAATIVRERVRQAGPEPIDRYNGGLVDWPGGNGPYLYGGFFHDYLVSRFGERKLGELIERQARRVHYFGSGAYEAVFGASLGRLWRDFMTSVEPASVPGGTVAPASPPAASARLTHHGFFVGSPRFAPDGASLFYTLQTPHRFPSIMRLDGAGASPQPMATQYGSEGITVGSDLVVFDQLELDASVALRADLYVVAAGGGRPRRLTENERLLQPALSPDGRSLAAVRLTGGARNLAWFDVERSPDGAMRVKERPGPDSGGQAGSPRWSPDGRQLAFERRITGGASEIVLLDLDGHSARVLASARTCRLVTPAWTPDGRAVVFASDQPAVPASDVLARSFQLYIVPAAGGSVRRLTAVPGGATSPAISPDGRRVVFVGYSEDGADLFEMPFESRGCRRGRLAAPARDAAARERGGDRRRCAAPTPTTAPTRP